MTPTRYPQNTPARTRRQTEIIDPCEAPRVRRHHAGHHRVKALHGPRGGVVNARRPGRRPGRSEAQSIDDAEHGASMKGAMVRGKIWIRERDVPSGKTWARANRFLFDSSAALFRRIGTRRRARGRRVLPARTVRQTATCGTTNDGVNDPVSTAWGHWRGRTAGSFTPSLVQRLRHRLR